MTKYLYNGIELPELPEWDKETYPYIALIDAEYDYYLLCTKLPFVYKVINEQGAIRNPSETTTTAYRYYISKNVGGDWSDDSPYGGTYNFIQNAGMADCVWANYDVTNEDGSVYLAASTPILVVNTAQGQSYLYNGIELPALPDWDKTLYPYAVIEKSQYGETLYFFHAFAEAPTMSGNNVTLPGDRVYCSSNGGADWGEIYNGTTISKGKGFIKWSNTDILNADGTIYLAASEPVPVPEWAEKDIYKRINGAWVKHDTYRRVNDAWVKQDEHLYS